MDKLLFGDNQFFGVNHMSEEKARAQLMQFRDVDAMMAVLDAAYDDALGVTAAFNLNLLARANRELGADFDLAAWEHAAHYQPSLQRIEMHLVSRCAQQVRVCGECFDFDEGESIHTENSYKYSVAGFQALARRAGWVPQAVWIDGARRFSLHWLLPAASDA